MTETFAIGILARAPSDGGGKTRLTRHVGLDDPAALRRAIVLDTLDAARKVRVDDLVVFCTPEGSESELLTLAGAGVRALPQRGADLGERLHHAFLELFAAGHTAALIIGSDLPTLPPAHIRSAVEALARPGDRVVLGPAEDGGYYLIGLKAPHPELFLGIPWSTDAVLSATIAAAGRLPVACVDRWYDVDSVQDLDRAIADAGAAHLRGWARAVGHRGSSDPGA